MIRGLGAMVLPDLPIYRREHRVKAVGNAVRLDVARRSEKAQRIGVYVDQMGRRPVGRVRHVVRKVDGGLSVRIEQTLDVLEVDQDTAWGLIAIYDYLSSPNWRTFMVVDWHFLTFGRGEREIIQFPGGQRVSRVWTLVEAILVLQFQQLHRDGSQMGLFAPDK